MANVVYPKFKEALLTQVHQMMTHAIKASLVRKSGADTGGLYTYSAAHTGKIDLGTTVADSAALTSPTIVGGTFDTADFAWVAVPAGNQVSLVVLWNDTPTTPVVDPLIVYLDTGMLGFPVTPNGGNINYAVHANGWFLL